jgi:Ca2+/Na+ antiporter
LLPLEEEEALVTAVGVAATGVTTATGTATGAAVCNLRRALGLSAVTEAMMAIRATRRKESLNILICCLFLELLKIVGDEWLQHNPGTRNA